MIPQIVLFETGTGNSKRLLNITIIAETIGQEMAKVLPAFHAFTGCDTTSAFVRKGKKTPMTLLMKNKQFIDVFAKLGNTATDVSEEINEGLKLNALFA